MDINYILKNEELKKLLKNSIAKTYNKFKLNYVIGREDFEQEVYLYIIPRLKNFDNDKSSLKTYIPLIVMSCARTCIQSANGQSKFFNKFDFEKSHLSLDYEFENEDNESVSIQNIISNDFEDMNTNILLNDILENSNLTEMQRTLLILKSKGYTTTDISKIMNKSLSGITNLFERTKKKIINNYIV